jgi:hypothetical protein
MTTTTDVFIIHSEPKNKMRWHLKDAPVVFSEKAKIASKIITGGEKIDEIDSILTEFFQPNIADVVHKNWNVLNQLDVYQNIRFQALITQRNEAHRTLAHLEKVVNQAHKQLRKAKKKEACKTFIKRSKGLWIQTKEQWKAHVQNVKDIKRKMLQFVSSDSMYLPFIPPPNPLDG